MNRRLIGIALLLSVTWIFCDSATAEDQVTINLGGEQVELCGRILVEAQHENGLLFQTRDGRIRILQPDQIVERASDDTPFEAFSRKQLGKQIQQELENAFEDQFRIHEADEFVVIYNTEKSYARWVAGLYRRFERGFGFYWTRKRFKPQKPEFPLAVVIFKSREQYHQHMKRQLGAVSQSMIAYYSIESNQVSMYDLTSEGFGAGNLTNDRQINSVLNNPRAIPMVATVIHEGTHLLMFNNGMQTRFSDTPLWINEGIAMYFEVPDLSSARGWGKIGEPNFLRLGHFLKYLRGRPRNSLQTMISSDAPFRGEQALDMYAQAWAFSYFLLNRHEDEFVEYLKFMATKPRSVYDSPEQRLADFEKFFEQDLAELDREFVNYVSRLGR